MLLVQGTRDRSEESWQRAAWIVAHVTAPWVETPVTPQQLLTPAPPADLDALLDPAAAFDELMKRQHDATTH